MTAIAPTTARAARVDDRTLARVQAASGLAFGAFLVLHLATFLAGLFGPAAFDGALERLRVVYQSPFVELPLVLGALLVHAGASVARLRRRRAAGPTRRPVSARTRLHRYAGYYLLTFVLGHVLATRLPGLQGHPADHGLVGLTLVEAGAWFYPYYALLALAGAVHLAHGTVVALGVLGARPPRLLRGSRSPVFWGWAAAWAGLAVLGVLALGGVTTELDPEVLAGWRAFFEESVPRWALPW